MSARSRRTTKTSGSAGWVTARAAAWFSPPPTAASNWRCGRPSGAGCWRSGSVRTIPTTWAGSRRACGGSGPSSSEMPTACGCAIRTRRFRSACGSAPGSPRRPPSRSRPTGRGGPAGRVQPRRLGHVVVGSLDQEASQRFFTEGLGFKVSDRVPGLASFMRCSTDHHNLLVQQAPLNFLHHTAWEVDDVDEVGRGATAMLEGHPERHIWGLGRHHIGSNFFWYLKDPVGNFSEYYSDLDIILDDQLWKPSVVEGARGLYNWGPPPPPSFIQPEDLAALMTGSHAPKA